MSGFESGRRGLILWHDYWLLMMKNRSASCWRLPFARMGTLVETVTSGQLAKKKIESQVYDVIIADIRMPDLTGIESAAARAGDA